MKRGPIILIGGAVLLIAGISIAAVWGVSFASSFMANNSIMGRTMVEPGQSITIKTDVTQIDKPLALIVGIDKSQGNERLRETITNPDGKMVSNNEFGSTYLTSIKPDITGTYTATVTNLGNNPVAVTGTFGHMPMIGSNGRPDINAMMSGQGLGMAIVGGLLAAAGVIVLVVGGIIAVIDSRGHQATAGTPTTKDGITYRKD